MWGRFTIRCVHIHRQWGRRCSDERYLRRCCSRCYCWHRYCDCSGAIIRCIADTIVGRNMHKRLRWTKIQCFIVNATDKIGPTYRKNNRIIRIDSFICLKIVNVSGFVSCIGGSVICLWLSLNLNGKYFIFFEKIDVKNNSFSFLRCQRQQHRLK